MSLQSVINQTLAIGATASYAALRKAEGDTKDISSAVERLGAAYDKSIALDNKIIKAYMPNASVQETNYEEQAKDLNAQTMLGAHNVRDYGKAQKKILSRAEEIKLGGGKREAANQESISTAKEVYSMGQIAMQKAQESMKQAQLEKRWREMGGVL